MPGTIRHRKEGRKGEWEEGRREGEGKGGEVKGKKGKKAHLKHTPYQGAPSVAGEKEADLDIGSQPC